VIKVLNRTIVGIGTSTGLTADKVATVSSNLDPDTVIGDSFTTLNIIEGLARSAEHAFLYEELKATCETRSDWGIHNVWGPYTPALTYTIEHLKDWAFATQTLMLSLQGRYFPFLGAETILLEDFHPVLLLPRIVERMAEQIVRQQARRFSDGVWVINAERAGHLFEELRREFKLVTSADDFWSNWLASIKNFESDFPHLARGEVYRNKVKERELLHTWRKEWFEEARSQPLHKPIKYPSISVFRDGPAGAPEILKDDNDAYIREGNEGYLHAASIEILLNCAIADYILFHDDTAWKTTAQFCRGLTGKGIDFKKILGNFGFADVRF